MGRAFRNTLVISGLSMTIGFVAPIVFALLLNEIHHTLFKKVVQTISYLPYFISWVVVASILFTLLGTDGNINELLLNMGVIDKPIAFLNEKNYFWGILTTSNIWKDVGWSAIIYISAIAGVDGTLYEAGSVDGLGRFGKAWHITLPGIAPTVIMLFIMGIGGLLSSGFEQIYLLRTPGNMDLADTLDVYVVRIGLLGGQFGYATAIGLIQGIVGLIMVVTANKICKKITEVSLW